MRHSHFRLAFVLVLLSGCTAHGLTGQRDGRPDSQAHWAEFSIRPSLAQSITETTVHVGNLRFAGADGLIEHWLRKTTRFFGGATRVQWTDTRRCVAARAVLSNLYALEMPRPALGGLIEVRADGVLYTLSTGGRYGTGPRSRLAQLSISAPGGTPLADWAEQSLAELEACWSDSSPVDVEERRTAGRP